MSSPTNHDPLRAPDWRWFQAGGKCRSRRSDDNWVRMAVKFLRRWSRCHEERDFLRLRDEMPAVYGAHDLFEATQSAIPWAIEARLLARESFEGIARKCGTTAEVIEAYTKLFFDVADALNSPDYIMGQVVGMAAFTDPAEAELGTYWRYLGYAGGPEVLDYVIDGRADCRERAEAFLAETTRFALVRKMAMAAHSVAVTEKTAQKLLKAFAPVLKQPGAKGRTTGTVLPGILPPLSRAEAEAAGGPPPASTGIPVDPPQDADPPREASAVPPEQQAVPIADTDLPPAILRRVDAVADREAVLT